MSDIAEHMSTANLAGKAAVMTGRAIFKEASALKERAVNDGHSDLEGWRIHSAFLAGVIHRMLRNAK